MNDMDNRRSFEGMDGKIYFIADPEAADIRGADWQYSKSYTNSLVEGITTSAEMTDILMRRGIIGPEFEQRANELAVELSNKIEALEKAKDVDEKRKVAIEVAEAREELFQWNQRLNGPMANTCEQIADDSRLEYLTSCIVQTESGDRVWESFDSYLSDRDKGQLAVQARYEVMLYLQGLNSDFMSQTPEAIAMKEVEDDLTRQAQAALAALDDVEAEVDDKRKSKSKSKPAKSVSKGKKNTKNK